MNNNKLIAEFMGWDIKLPTTIPTNLHLSNLELDNKEIFDLKFHTSWDWLMPVVEKIESLRDTNGDAYRFTIDMCNAQIEGTHIEIIGGAYKLNTTYQAVIEFIESY